MRAIVTVVALVLMVATAAAEPLRVVNIAPNDVLNVRELPTTQSRIVGVIPPDGRAVEYEGERRGAWLFVRYRNVEGWVDARYVLPDAPPIRRGRVVGPGE